jgi:cyclohexanone monooxygenase
MLTAPPVSGSMKGQDAWVERVASLVRGTIRASESWNSWYLGASVPGKPRVFMTDVGGLPSYRQRCDEVAAAGYDGFILNR